MLAAPDLRRGLGRFLAGRTYAALSARDRDGRLWVAPLAGAPGFLEVRGPGRLLVHAAPAAGDPLHALPAGRPAGLLVIEYAIRRRVRVNGRLAASASGVLDIEVSEAYGNCPQHIPPHALVPAARPYDTAAPVEPAVRTRLTAADRELIARADTFVLGTTHPEKGNDASHRGGPPGFAAADPAGATVTWPDYPGNNMFNSLGNLAVDPAAALLFTDFATGAALHLSGTAGVDWGRAGGTATGRAVVFRVARAVTGPPPPVRLAAPPDHAPTI
jgi:hypothetical protein